MFLGEAPENRPANWYPPPNTRGTFTILSTCIITLGLCIWSALHLNIPEQQKEQMCSKWDPISWIAKHKWRKVGWLMVGILAPEMIAFSAWVQRRDARRLSKELGNHLMGPDDIRDPGPSRPDVEVASPEEHRTRRRRHVWTPMHSFFVVMGGFVFDASELPEEEKFLPGSRDRVTLTPKALLFLAEKEPSLVPDISKATIIDKSKADALAKGIVCLQACWFIVQCIVRIAQGLPISLLELNTFTHALCALLIYGLWWEKPLDIEEPFLLDIKEMHGIIALLCFRSKFDDGRDGQRVMFEYTDLEALDSGLDSLTNGSECCNSAQSTASASWSLQFRNGTRELEVLYDGVRVIGAPVKALMGLSAKSPDHSNHRRRWALAISAWKKYGNMPHLYLLRDRMRNWPADLHGDAISDGIDRPIIGLDSDAQSIFFVFTLAGLLYGGIHLLAWKAPFTSDVHRSLWRISAVTVASSGFAILSIGGAFVSAYKVLNMLSRQKWPERIYKIWLNVCTHWKLIRHHDWLSKKVGYAINLLFKIMLAAFFFAGIVLYLLARAYLVVECFISLAYLPESVFQQGQWAAYFPHIA